jgi:hypothetical protein
VQVAMLAGMAQARAAPHRPLSRRPDCRAALDGVGVDAPGDQIDGLKEALDSMILRCSASEGGGTSRFASDLIGQRETIHTTVARSHRPTELLATTSRSEHFSIEPAVMGSEIEQLRDLAGYLKLASRSEWLRVQLAPPPGATHRGYQL